MFKKAKPEIDQYMAMKIDGPGKKVSKSQETKILTKQLVDKATALKDTEALFIEIIGTGAGEWGLACLVELGKAYENMASSLRESYVPPYLNEDQADYYRVGLEDKAYPQEEKAAEAYSRALEKSFELNLYNDRTSYATRRLGELRPADFPSSRKRSSRRGTPRARPSRSASSTRPESTRRPRVKPRAGGSVCTNSNRRVIAHSASSHSPGGPRRSQTQLPHRTEQRSREDPLMNTPRSLLLALSLLGAPLVGCGPKDDGSLARRTASSTRRSP